MGTSHSTEYIHVPATAPSSDWVNLTFKLDTSTGFRYRNDQDLVLDVTVNNTSSQPFIAGELTAHGSSMFREGKALCPAIPSGQSETVRMVLSRKSKEVEDMQPECKFTYTNPSFGNYEQAEPVPVFLFTAGFLPLKPTETIPVQGVEQTKQDFVIINLGQAGSGKSSLMCGLATVLQQTPASGRNWVAAPCMIGSSAAHCTEAITRIKMGLDFHLVGMDGWGMDSDKWKVLDHIIDYAKGIFREEITMHDEIATRPLTAWEKEALEPTRKPNEANVVIVTILASSLLSDDPTVRNETKKIADIARRANFPVAVIVSQVDQICHPDCSIIREDSESPPAKQAARTFIDRAKAEFGVPESEIFLTIAHNTGPNGMDTPQQRWNIDRMYLKILTGIMAASVCSDANRAYQAKEAKGGHLGFYAALAQAKAAQAQAGVPERGG